MSDKNLERLSENFAYKTKDEQMLEVIEKFYPGVNNLTANEVCLFSEFDSIHKYQHHIAVRRMFPKDFKDTSKVVGVKQIEKIRKEINSQSTGLT